jgi:hypothetical protein
MADATLAPEFDRLKKDVGDWDASITITPGPGAPPQESTGRLSARLISGGRWLITDFKNHTTGFEGHGIYGFNPGTKRYVGTWVDDMRAQIYVGEGAWDDASQTMTYSWSATMPDGRAMTWKETSRTTAENERIFRVVFPSPDGTEFEMMRVVYRR